MVPTQNKQIDELKCDSFINFKSAEQSSKTEQNESKSATQYWRNFFLLTPFNHNLKRK